MTSLSLNDLLKRFELNRSDPTTQIAALKRKLAKTDYKAIKFAEGWITKEDYEPIKQERQAIRDQINALEAQLAAPAAEQTEGGNDE